MTALPENQIAREARRILRKLADAKSRLVQRADGAWTVVQRGDAASGRTKTSAQYVAAFRARGWIEPLPHPEAALVLTSAGHTWIFGTLGVEALSVPHRQLRLRTVRDDEGDETLVAENEAESPLAWLKSREAISDAQFDAGERLRRDYTIARIEPRLCIDLSAPVVLGGGGAAGAAQMPDAVLAAKQRFAKALSAVGPGLSDLLFDVCCALRGLEALERDKKWPRRSGKVVLGLALERLAAHYGLSRPAPKPRLRSWSADFLEPAP